MRPEPGPPVALSTASVYPEPVAAGFELAAELGYDGVELMVWGDRVSQDVAAVGRLAERHGVPVVAVHAPCLVVTQRVWGADPIVRIRRSVAAAEQLGASTVVLHPPFRWQQRYAARFADEVARAGEVAGVALAVENMFPVVRGRMRTVPYEPGFDPTEVGHRYYTLDLSHTATAGTDALELLDRMGAGLRHLHLADGSGGPRDEHLVPGRGTQPCAEVLQRLVDTGYGGAVVAEVSTRRCRTRYERAETLAHALLFARLHLQPLDREDDAARPTISVRAPEPPPTASPPEQPPPTGGRAPEPAEGRAGQRPPVGDRGPEPAPSGVRPRSPAEDRVPEPAEGRAGQRPPGGGREPESPAGKQPRTGDGTPAPAESRGVRRPPVGGRGPEPAESGAGQRPPIGDGAPERPPIVSRAEKRPPSGSRRPDAVQAEGRAGQRPTTASREVARPTV